MADCCHIMSEKIDPVSGKRVRYISIESSKSTRAMPIHNVVKKTRIDKDIDTENFSSRIRNTDNGYRVTRSDKTVRRLNLLESDSDDDREVNRSGRKTDSDGLHKDSDILKPDEIRERLKNFERVADEDLKSIAPHTKIQYFDISDGSCRYRPGGSLLYNHAPKYIVLTNGGKSWSIQLDSVIIFKEKDYDKLKKEYEILISKKDKEISTYKLYVKKQKEAIDELVNEIKLLKTKR